jgi:dTDP-4-amino-4,6-dideoxygalactose transaminase
MIPWSMPPAESKLPLSALLHGWLPGKVNFTGTLEDYWGEGPVFLANSATTLLSLVFRALRQETGRQEILMPGYTCYSVAAAAVRAECKIVLYDLDPDSFQPDLDDVAKKISTQTIAVVGQHLLGIPGDIASLSALAHQNGCYCVEDSAQRCVTEMERHPQEKGADCTAFSFGRGKPLPLGGGGALQVLNKDLKNIMSSKVVELTHSFSSGAKVVATQILSHPYLYWIPEKLPLGLGKTVYDQNFKMESMSHFFNRLGGHTICHLENYNKNRINLSSLYNEQLLPVSKMAEQLAGDMPPCIRYPLLIKDVGSIKELGKYGVRRMYPLALGDLQDIQNSFGSTRGKTPSAKNIAEHLITLPTHMGVTPEMALLIAKKVAAASC